MTAVLRIPCEIKGGHVGISWEAVDIIQGVMMARDTVGLVEVK